TVAPTSGGSETGAPSSLAAVNGFFAAMQAGALQAASAYWGTHAGSARAQMGRDEMETRLLGMQCYLSHESMRVVSQPRTKSDSAFYRVELSSGTKSQQTDVVAVAGPRSRWYVADPKITGLAPSCGR